ncbi:hypothetical protein E1293_01160 [Actinomadura darangshiensis]|uniref:Protein activator of alkane oxidation PraB n=1 Tax=Actinomadura darangshiensis TaxID=705336 RepID=A0A4R5C5K9_9ACTN|nr:hypothetical protein [Actinomadura darangshiensis]TDD92152.1 hypothetical protein E1293_01160 [Actinomadura darangshiensis]
MSRTTKTAAIASAFAATALTFAVTATPAMAWTAGDFTATLNGTMTIDAGIPATCTGSTLSGTIAEDGTLSVTSASVSGCGVDVTPENLPWSGSLAGGVATLSGFSMSAIGCTFGGSITGAYTGTDLPITATFTEQTVNKTSGVLCPSSATLTATYDFAAA